MHLKIQTPEGNWLIKEAKTIQYSESAYLLTSRDMQRSPGIYHPFIPVAIQYILEKAGGFNSHDIEVLPFQSNLIYEIVDGSNQENNPCSKEIRWNKFPEQHDGCLYVNMLFDLKEPKPPEWFAHPMYSYAILDGKKAIVFPTKAFVLNDDGKTIAKIG